MELSVFNATAEYAVVNTWMTPVFTDVPGLVPPYVLLPHITRLPLLFNAAYALFIEYTATTSAVKDDATFTGEVVLPP